MFWCLDIISILLPQQIPEKSLRVLHPVLSPAQTRRPVPTDSRDRTTPEITKALESNSPTSQFSVLDPHCPRTSGSWANEDEVCSVGGESVDRDGSAPRSSTAATAAGETAVMEAVATRHDENNVPIIDSCTLRETIVGTIVDSLSVTGECTEQGQGQGQDQGHSGGDDDEKLVVLCHTLTHTRTASASHSPYSAAQPGTQFGLDISTAPVFNVNTFLPPMSTERSSTYVSANAPTLPHIPPCTHQLT